MKKIPLLFICFLAAWHLCQAQRWEAQRDRIEAAKAEGQYADALSLALRAIPMAEKEFGQTHANYLIALSDAALLHQDLGQFDAAYKLHQEALIKAEAILGKAHPDYPIYLNNLAGIFKAMGDYDRALPIYREVLELGISIQGASHADIGIYQRNLGGLYLAMGDYKSALPLYQDALLNCEKNFDRQHPNRAKRLSDLAWVYKQLGNPEQAMPLIREAMEINERHYGKEHQAYVRTLVIFAELQADMGAYDAAVQAYETAVRIAAKNQDNDPDGYARKNWGLANVYEATGQYEKALPRYLDALGRLGASIGTDHPEYGQCLSGLGGLYASLGQLDKAISHYRQALTIADSAYGKGSPAYAQLLNNIGHAYHEQGNYEQAFAYYQQAFDIAAVSLGESHPDYITYLQNLAGVFHSAGRKERALGYYQDAIRLIEKHHGQANPNYASTAQGLASVCEDLGKYDLAMQYYTSSLQSIEQTVGKNAPEYRSGLENLAGLLEKQGKPEQAYRLLSESMDLLEQQVYAHFGALSEQEKEQFIASVQYSYASFHSFVYQHAAVNRQSHARLFDMEMLQTGLILQHTMQVQQRILAGGNDSAQRLYARWMQLKSQLARHYAQPIADRPGNLGAMEAEAGRMEGQLTRLSAAFADYSSTQRVRWTDIRAGLKPGETALQFAAFRYHDGRRWTDSTLYTAMLLRSGDNEPRLVKLFEQRQLDSLLQQEGGDDAAYVSTLYRGARTVGSGTARHGYGQRLSALIWKPLEAYIPAGSDVYFVPAGRLHQIAFAALPVNGDSLLSRRHRLHQLSSLSQMLRTRQLAPPASIAVYGGIDYDAGAAERSSRFSDTLLRPGFVSRSLSADLTRSGSWNYLPGTRDEALSIARMAEARKLQLHSHTGADALEERYKAISAAASPDVIHIATHGFFFPDPKLEPQDPKDPAAGAFRLSDNPLNRAGLLFAGANLSWQGKAPEDLEDGILTAYEAANVPLRNTQLVTLSACETGLGDIRGSEGVFGLQRAFKMAGAEYLLMSLWKVPDAETAAFMEQFYSRWFSGQPIDAAFRGTQKEMQRRYPDAPYNWAAFVLVR